MFWPESSGLMSGNDMTPYLSLVIPAYNEAGRISKTLPAAVAYLKRQNFSSEIIMVDDGSSDETVVEAAKILKTVKHIIIKNEGNRGKGFSVKQGMLAAKGTYCLFSDADFSTPLEDVEKLIKPLKEGYDVAIGSRGLLESQVEVRQNPIRELMGKTFNRLARLLTFRGIKDSQCGFKCFTRQAAKRLFGLQKMDGFSFDVEILYLAQKLGYKVAEVPVVWRNSPASTVRMFRDSMKMFVDLFTIRVKHMANHDLRA